jgi:hypothetical protein
MVLLTRAFARGKCSSPPYLIICDDNVLHKDWPNHRLRCIPATFEDLGTLSGPISADRSLISIAGILLAPHDGNWIISGVIISDAAPN